MTFLTKFAEPSYLLMRLFCGLFFVQHGTQKLLNFPAPFPYDLNPMSTAAGWIELVLGIAIAIGLLTRLAAFLSSGMSAVGYWIAHGTADFYPINNGGELIAMYCFVFLFIACRGPGMLSLDGMLGIEKPATA